MKINPFESWTEELAAIREGAGETEPIDLDSWRERYYLKNYTPMQAFLADLEDVPDLTDEEIEAMAAEEAEIQGRPQDSYPLVDLSDIPFL